MVLVIFIVGMFLGFSLGFAAMALVAARNQRLEYEEVRVTEGSACRSRLDGALPARPPASGAAGLLPASLGR